MDFDDENIKITVNTCLISEVLAVPILMVQKTHDSNVKRSSYHPKQDSGPVLQYLKLFRNYFTRLK